MERMDPRTEPWGTPEVTTKNLDVRNCQKNENELVVNSRGL